MADERLKELLKKRRLEEEKKNKKQGKNGWMDKNRMEETSEAFRKRDILKKLKERYSK